MSEDLVDIHHVPETAFGKWFLSTNVWTVHVLERALIDVDRLIPDRRTNYPVVLDVGCGWGRSLSKLNARFSPERLVGIDVDQMMVEAARREAAAARVRAEVIRAGCDHLPLADASVDLLFCHQTFHHLARQEAAMSEFFRVLRPGGLLLFAESTRRYIHSWLIRCLFRHPMEVQKTAEEYVGLIRGAGFQVADQCVSFPFLWWSREDLGIAERWFGIAPPTLREETLVNLVALKP